MLYQQNIENFILMCVLLISLFLSFLKALSDIQIAVKMVKASEDSNENPLDRHYRALHCRLQPLDNGCHEYKVCSNRSKL